MRKRFTGILFTLLLSLFSFTWVNAGYEIYQDGAPAKPNKTYTSSFSAVEVTGLRNVCGEYDIFIEKIPDQSISYSFLRIAQLSVAPGGDTKHISGFLNTDGSFRIKNEAEKTTNVAVIEPGFLYTFKWNADFYTGKIIVDVLKEGVKIADYETDITYDKVLITEYDNVYLTGVRIGIEKGTVATIGNLKEYSVSTDVFEKNFSDGEEVKNDFSPEIIFDAELDPESLSGISLTDENGSEIAVEAQLSPYNEAAVKIIPKHGLEYSTAYELKIPSTVKSTDDIYAKPVTYNFTTEENPAKCELYVDGEGVHFYEKNPSPYDKTRYILINTFDEEGFIIKSEKKTVTVNACDEATTVFPVDGTVTAEFFDEFKGFDYIKYEEIGLENGIIDRAFDENHHLYKITMNSGAGMPEIAVDGMTKEVKEDVIILSDGVNSYRFVIANESAAPEYSEPEFESDTKVIFNNAGEGKKKILITMPKSLGADEAYTIDEFLKDEDVIAEVKSLDGESLEYVFSEDALSGRYNFYIVYEGSDELSKYSVYYASRKVLEECESAWQGLKNSETAVTDTQFDDFVKKYANILKLDISEYVNLKTQSIKDYVLANADATTADFCVKFKEAVLVAGFNEAENKSQFVASHADVAGVTVSEAWISGASEILKSLSAKTPADIAKLVEYSNAIVVINGAEPSDILSKVANNATVLELTEAQIAKLGKPIYKVSLIAALTQKGFTDAKQIGSAIDGAKPADDGSNSSNKPSNVTIGGGGGGGGGGNTVVSYVEPTKTDKQKEENSEPNTGEENNSSDTTNTVENGVFSDITEASWAKEAIEYLYNEKIVSGSGDGTYRPNNNIKREEFIKILVEALDIEHRQESDVFEDAALGQWYTPYIYAAYSGGIVSGISDTQFGVGVDITRQDIAVMINRAITAAKLTISDVREASVFADSADIADYAAESIDSLFAKGILNGNDKGEFLPGEKATRAEVAQVIYNLINRVNDGEEEQK